MDSAVTTPEKATVDETSYVPTYANPPLVDLDFDTILTMAERRNEFHRHLSFETREGSLNYERARALSVDFGIPFRRFLTNSDEIETDKVAFFSLMMASLDSHDSINRFAENECRLMNFRLNMTSVSIAEIGEYFWPNRELRELIIANYSVKHNFSLVPFERIFGEMNVRTADVTAGNVRVTIDGIYRLVSRCFKRKINAIALKYTEARGEYETIRKSLATEMERRRGPTFSVDQIHTLGSRSFPPCMFRVLKALKRNHRTSYKGRFELSMFFKGIGLDYFSQYEFWKSAIWTRDSAWHFESQVVVGLKQIYGLDDGEGDVDPQNCITMINHDRPLYPRQVQGCPFSHLSKAELKIGLKAMRRGVKHTEIDKLAHIGEEQPTEACLQFFNGTFANKPTRSAPIQTPIDFFIDAEKQCLILEGCH